jgi:hypothetical protein
MYRYSSTALCRSVEERCRRYELFGVCPRGNFCPQAASHTTPGLRHAAVTGKISHFHINMWQCCESEFDE